ncbi:MAG: glycoside hydrolase family 65 protein [Aggregatilineales bacterium]
MSLIDQRAWQLSEAPFNPGKLHHTETIHSVGNGYMGVRATFEEGYPGELPSTLVHGIFDHAAGELVPELVVLPNPLSLTISVNDETFHMSKGRILGYRQMLDLQKALLTRGVLWQTSAGRIVQITFERFASLAREHLLCQRITVQALNGPCKLDMRAWIDGGATNDGVKHWGTLETISMDQPGRIVLRGVTGQSGYGVAVGSALISSEKSSATPDLSDPIRPAAAFTLDLAEGQAVTLTRYTAIHTTRDSLGQRSYQGDPVDNARSTLDSAEHTGYDALFAEHVAEWAKYWHDSDVEIDGDELAQRAIRFTTYHVLIAAPRHDEHASIGAKTLSGPGYKGHVFWDTELFIVPLLTLTQPRLARNLLMYRYYTLQGARNKAKEAGYEGAMYPWEATDTGEETTPRWTNPYPDGARIRIWTGDNEQHISTDITYAVLQYWRWTEDAEFFVHYGAEIVLDTAVFWGSRVEFNAKESRYELSQQIGPDEYHENINNSVFTNSVVRWHLRSALEVLAWLQTTYPQQAAALTDRLKLTPERLEKWHDIIARMYIPRDEGRGILEQFEGFFKLEPLDLAPWQPRVANMDAILGHEPTQHVAVIKQADVVMLTALLPEAVGDEAAQRRNWEVYYPIVDHGSSLSPAMHAWVAARLGLMDEAYEMFAYAGTIDLEDNKGNVRDGIHAAAAGGLWQAAVFGFAGLQLAANSDGFTLDPHLPDGWRGMRFRIYRRGIQRMIRLTAENILP